MITTERPRFFGLYRGKVVSTDDPLGKQRIKAVIPQVLGQNITGCLEPCLPVVLQVVTAPTDNASISTTGPTIGSGIWIMFEAGDPDYPIWIGVSS